MRKLSFCAISLLLTVFIGGCAKPDRITTINSPFDGVFYTIEAFKGHGAADSDFTRVYAHLQRDGKTDKQLVLDGTYLELYKVVWNGPSDVTLCMKSGGVTNSFRNEVTLLAGENSETIRNHLRESCDFDAAPAPTSLLSTR
jgi:hypothetical protein